MNASIVLLQPPWQIDTFSHRVMLTPCREVPSGLLGEGVEILDWVNDALFAPTRDDDRGVAVSRQQMLHLGVDNCAIGEVRNMLMLGLSYRMCLGC